MSVILLALAILAVATYLPVTSTPQPRRVPWSEALLLLYSGNVTLAVQFHNLTVLLTMKDGTVVVTHEPAIDQIFEEGGKCGEPCKNTVLGTE